VWLWVTVGEVVDDLDAFSDKLETGIKSSRSLDAIFLFSLSPFLFPFFLSLFQKQNVKLNQQISFTLALNSSYQFWCVASFTFYYLILWHHYFIKFQFLVFYYILYYICTKYIIRLISRMIFIFHVSVWYYF